MANDIVLGITLTGDGSDLVGELRLSDKALAQVEDGIEDVGQAADKAEKKTSKLSRAASLLGKGMAIAGVAVAGAAAGLLAFSAHAIDSADAIGKTADKIGIGVEALQELRYASELSGVAQNNLDLAMQRFSRRLGEAATGTGELLPALQRYGIAITDSHGRTRAMEDVLADYADAVADAGSSQEQLRLAFKAFDSEGAALVNMLRGGSEALDAMRGEARDLGFVLSRLDTAKAAAANDALTRLGMVLHGLGNRIAVATAPYLKLFADLLADGLKQTGWLTKSVGWLAENTIHAVAAIVDAWSVAKKLWVLVGIGFGEFVNFTLQGLATLERGVLSLANLIPGIDPPESSFITEWADESERALQQFRQAAADILSEPLPGDALLAKFNEINRQIEEAARQSGQNRPGLGISLVPPPPSDEEIETTVARTADMLGRMRGVRQAHLAAFEAIKEAEARAAEDAERRKVVAAQAGMTALGNLASLQNAQSRRMFEVGKAAAIGETVIQTYRAAQGAYAALAHIPVIGPGLGAAAAFAATLAGVARVQQIKSQQFGGGASVSAAGGSAAAGAGGGSTGGGFNRPSISAAPPPVPAPQPRVFNVTFDSSTGLLPAETVIGLMRQMADFAGDGLEFNPRTA